MKKASTLPILFSIVLTFFLLYGLAFASDKKMPAKADIPNAMPTQNKNTQHPEVKTNHNRQSPTIASIDQKKIDLQFFQSHLQKEMTKADVVSLLGEKYRVCLTDQSGELAWTYDFPKDPTYQTTVPPYAVDENGILTNKMLYQLSIVWNGDKIKSYIVFYNNHGTIGELKGKFFDGSYSNE